MPMLTWDPDDGTAKPTAAVAAVRRAVAPTVLTWSEAADIWARGWMNVADVNVETALAAFKDAGVEVSGPCEQGAAEPAQDIDDVALRVALALMAQSEGNPLHAAAFARTLRVASGDALYEDVIDVLADVFSPWLDDLIDQNNLRAGDNA